ncbi:MAG: dTDP-4-dehydrorhamnose reductase [Candidatus Bathyarchaeota archaeon]
MEIRDYPMRLLITGASGLLGLRLSQKANKDHEVHSAYHRHRPIHGRFIQLDITDRESLKKAFEEVNPEVVVHTAALTNVDKCESKKKLAWRTNVEGTKNIAECCQRHESYLLYISTDYIFSGEKGMYREIDEPDPINYYGLTKLRGEEAIKSITDYYCIARTSVVFGSTQSTNKTNFALWVLQKLANREKIKIITDQWNSPTLNTNLADMILEVLERRLIGTFHLAGAKRLNRYRLAKLLAENFNLDKSLIKPSLSKEIQWTAKRPKDSSLNVEKALKTLKNRPIEIEEALRQLRKEMA